MTNKQQLFVGEYLTDFNATQAAIRAGYSEKTAQAIGAENLTKPLIAEAIAAAVKARSKRTEITQDRVLEELARIGFADIRKLFTWDDERSVFVPSPDLTEADAAVISAIESKTTYEYDSDGERSNARVELKLRTYDKLGALDKLAKHLGMFTEHIHLKAEITTNVRAMSDEELLERGADYANRIAAQVGPSTNGDGG